MRLGLNFQVQHFLRKTVVIICKTPVFIFIYLIIGLSVPVIAGDYLAVMRTGGIIDRDSSVSTLTTVTSTGLQPLVADIAAGGEVMLHWTAPGDDGYIGRAAGYDIRYWPSRFGPINSEYKWISAYYVTGEPTPSPAGRRDSMLVTDLESGADYYFCIKAFDEAGNYSGLSNSPLLTASNLGYTIRIDISGRGSVSCQPDRPYYQYGETVTLTAVPDDYWEFGGWSGDIQSNSNPVNFIIVRDMQVTVTFSTDYIPGDANNDGRLNSSDITYLVNFMNGHVPPPTPYLAGDANGDCNITGNDITYILNYFRGGGPPPVRGDCENIFISSGADDISR